MQSLAVQSLCNLLETLLLPLAQFCYFIAVNSSSYFTRESGVPLPWHNIKTRCIVVMCGLLCGFVLLPTQAWFVLPVIVTSFHG